MKLIKELKKRINNRKGEMSLMFMFSMIFLFWIIMFIIDLFRLTYIHLDATSVAREVTEIISNQGGIAQTAPTQYPEQSTYVNSTKLTKLVYDTMLNVGVDRGDLVLVGAGNNGQNVTVNENTNVAIDYGKPVTVRLRYSMRFISLPDSSDQSRMVFNVTRNSRSKYKHRTGTQWEGDTL